MIKSCQTCDRRQGSMEFAKCTYSGYHCKTERQYPNRCGLNYEHGWVQRRGFWARLFGINK